MEGREGEEERPILLKDWIGRGGKREKREREERVKKGRGAACLKKSFPRLCPVSINLAARLKCYRRHGPL